MRLPFSDETRRRIGIAFGAYSIGLSVAAIGSFVIVGDWAFLVEIGGLAFGVMGVGFGLLTLVMIRPQPRNGAVWAIAWAGVFAASYVAGAAVAVRFTLDVSPGLTYEVFRELSPAELSLAAALALHFRFWALYPAIWLPLTLGLLLFPDGHAPSRRWNWVGWWSVLAIATGAIAAAISGNPWSTMPIRSAETTVSGTAGAFMTAGFLLAALSAIVSVVSLLVRYRRSSGIARNQIRWIAFGGVVLVAFIFVVPSFESGGGANLVLEVLGVVALLGLMATYGIAITKYRLYDIDVVISKTVTYGVLAAFITGVYALVVVGIGSLFGGGDEPNLALSIVAVAIVAVAFEPVRGRVQHWANVLVYGKRATPYEVLAGATARLSDTSDPDDALGRVTQLVVDGTGAVGAVLWLKVGGVMYPRASSPEDVVAGVGPVSGDDPVAAIPGDRVVAVRHRGDVLGALSISKGRADAVTESDEKVLGDVAAGAGVLLRNMGLNAELAERAEQLRVSRRRLVAAQDAERRRLERDLHDGAQQQVVALKVKLGIARTLAEREGVGPVADLVVSLADTTQEAVDGMRAVAHGIYPPLLEAEGLEAALSGMQRTVPIPVGITAVAVSRYEQSVEESAYFCVVEVISKAVDAGASRIDVSLTGSDAGLVFVVGFDAASTDLQAIRDRVAAFDGSMEVSSQNLRGAITGFLPTTERSLEPA